MAIYTICLVHIFYNPDLFSFLTRLLFVSFKKMHGMPSCLCFFCFFFWFFFFVLFLFFSPFDGDDAENRQ